MLARRVGEILLRPGRLPVVGQAHRTRMKDPNNPGENAPDEIVDADFDVVDDDKKPVDPADRAIENLAAHFYGLNLKPGQTDQEPPKPQGPATTAKSHCIANVVLLLVTFACGFGTAEYFSQDRAKKAREDLASAARQLQNAEEQWSKDVAICKKIHDAHSRINAVLGFPDDDPDADPLGLNIY
jgi:hypothetical protein